MTAVERQAEDTNRTIHCRGCHVPILRIGHQGGGFALQAGIAGWEWHYGRLRLVLRCAECGKRRRFPIEEVRH